MLIIDLIDPPLLYTEQSLHALFALLYLGELAIVVMPVCKTLCNQYVALTWHLLGYIPVQTRPTYTSLICWENRNRIVSVKVRVLKVVN